MLLVFCLVRPKTSNRTVKSDFENQIRDCKERNEQFALKLVFSSVKSRVGGSIPDNKQLRLVGYGIVANELIIILFMVVGDITQYIVGTFELQIVDGIYTYCGIV